MERHPRIPEGSESLLLCHRGERLLPYDDITGQALVRGATLQGHVKIGIGRDLSVRGITTGESRLMLVQDAVSTWSDLLAALPWVAGLSRVRQLVFLDLAFSLDEVTTLLKFKKTLDATRLGRYDDASVLLLQSQWAECAGPRARRLAEMMRSDTLPTDVKGL